jgi:hypothetical protein
MEEVSEHVLETEQVVINGEAVESFYCSEIKYEAHDAYSEGYYCIRLFQLNLFSFQVRKWRLLWIS